MNELQRLQAWYQAQCNDQWEHAYGVAIDTLDNPGWRVRIDLADTALDGQAFEPLAHGDPDTDTSWIDCKLHARQFVGFGGPGDLAGVLRVFLDWAGV